MSDRPFEATCPRCGLAAPTGALQACPGCLLAGLDDAEDMPDNPQGLELIAEVGRGGMGRVFRARHVKLDRQVAVKLLPAELAHEPAFGARFEREARLLARLSHPNIVTVHDFGALSDGSGYLVMEYVAGGTLRERLPLAPRDAGRVAVELGRALAYAHAAGVVHRDLKPENVLFDVDGRARLADFGIARLVVDENTALTSPLAVLGTPRYMAPEARAGAPADPRGDVYALGIMLLEMLGPVAPTTEHAHLLTVAKRASAHDASARYRDGAELLDALEHGTPVEAQRAPTGAHTSLSLDALPAEHLSLLRAVALTLAGATGVSLYAVLLSITPRVLQSGEALPLAIYEAQRLADGRLATRARFEIWPTLWAAAAWAVAFVAYGLLRGQWRRAGLDVSRPEQPLAAVVKPVVRLALGLNLLFGAHLLLQRTSLRALVIYVPILGGVLELVMVYLVWVAILEALRVSRPLRREPWLWCAAALGLVPPTVSMIQLWRTGAMP